MDSNALPGFTNRQLARFVDRAALTFDEALAYFGNKGVVTGNPVRKEFFEIGPKEREERIHILIFGGSQGARAINTAMAEALGRLEPYAERIHITHQTGESDFERVADRYALTAFSQSDIRPFISDIFLEFAKADLVVSRAGATTCAELAAAGKASIMIPLPTAADDHQRKNAEAFEKVGAAKMLLQKDLNGKRLAEEILRMLEHPEDITRMEGAAKRLARGDAAEKTVDILEQLSSREGKLAHKGGKEARSAA
jgi:UDP-N-acetylglucosamine--N-acetylmuramyl-(pentapeptide) pyrophosphoryl-undecaprenol N-acetylglucosamine transferase